MKISIITATYNSASTVGDTLESVKIQSYPEVEHLIVDGASIDDTLSVVNRFPHVSKVTSEKDRGIYDAMNKGIGMATGDIVGILNSDDYYVDSKVISDIVRLFEADENVDCVYADLSYVSQHNTDKVVRKWKSGHINDRSFLHGWMPPHPTFFVRKSVYEKYGKFNIDMGTAADYELMLRFLEKYHCKAAYLPRTIIHMRTGGASNESVYSRLKAHTNDRKAWEVNGLSPAFYTLYLKPLRKIIQFV